MEQQCQRCPKSNPVLEAIDDAMHPESGGITTSKQSAVERSIRGRRNAKAGNRSEEIVCSLLRQTGFVMVEPINRAWIIHRSGGRITGASPAKKVSGDISAMTIDGKKVLAEVKTRQDGDDGAKLLFSAIEKHQAEALDTVHRFRGVALLVWYRNPYEIAVMRWPIPGFKPRTSLRWDDAKNLDIREQKSQSKQ